ncbi:MAG: hypothetical protein KDB27_20365, partial [Planctomycetales bacterium]|nr:hypothetical protein [Planctomycetales bacterium]
MSKQSKLTEVAPVLAEVVEAQRAGPHGDACHSCGSPVEKLDPFCGACGTPHSVTASVVQPYSQRESVSTRYASGTSSGVAVDSVTASNDGTTYGSDERANHKFFECKNCGATVSMDADHRSYVCAFCDSTYVAEYSPETTGRRRPDFVIGFEVTPEQAHEKFNQWINTNAWFRPGDLDQARVDERLVGVYLPFWSFSMLAKSEWSARIGEYWYRTETYTVKNAEGKTETRTRQVRETEWWSLTGQHQQYYTGYLVSG